MKGTQPVLKKNVKQEEVNSYLSYLLDRYCYTESKLRVKLNARYPHQPEMHDPAIEDAIESGKFDEKRYGELYLDGLLNKKNGPQKIKSQLIKKGFSREIIDELINSDEFKEIDKYKLAREFRIKCFGEELITDKKLYQRALNKILRNGFSYGEAISAMKLEERG